MFALASAAVNRLAHPIETSRAEVVMPNVWPVAQGHASWVVEVWTNYISNAIKYGGTPPVIELGADEQADGMIRFWVRDNGPGLTEEQCACLFQEFARLDQHQEIEGHGLGLSIVRRIVDKLGGAVGVESDVGEGSVFFFTLRRYEETSDE
jgi:signal transduction histidine kinase